MDESPALAPSADLEPTRFEAEIGRLGTLPQVWAAMVDFVRGRGGLRIGYHHLPPPGATDAGALRIENDGFGEALLARYLAARQAGRAVMANYALSSVQPIYLDEVIDRPELTEAEREHLAAYRDAGVRNGVVFTAYGPNSRNGLFAMELPANLLRLSEEDIGALRWAGQAMHLRYCDLLLPQLGRPPNLSHREAEVLSWVARGKSNSSIAEILGISAHTVDAHLRRIYLKLGVVDRLSAALRALGIGLIHVEA